MLFLPPIARARRVLVFSVLAANGLLAIAHAAPGNTAPRSNWPAPANAQRDDDYYDDGTDAHNQADAPDQGEDAWDDALWNSPQVLSGVVSRRLSTTDYTLRTSNGNTVRVHLPEATTLRVGDELRVGGDWRNQTFYADVVVPIGGDEADDQSDADEDGNGDANANPEYPGEFRTRTDLSGVVAHQFDPRTFELLTNTGRTYLVRGTNATPNLREGDSVRVAGFARGNRVRATQVSNLSRNGGIVGGVRPGSNWNAPGRPNPRPGNTNAPDYDYDNSSARVGVDVDFPARIENIARTGQDAIVRGDNNFVYRLHVAQNELQGYRVGDRIRVRGLARNGVVEADDIYRTR